MAGWVWVVVATSAWVLLFAWRLVVAALFLRRLSRIRQHVRRFHRCAVPATGQVVDNQFESVPGQSELVPAMVLGGGGNLDYGVAQAQGPAGLVFHPVIEFTTGDGQLVRFAAETASSRSWVSGQSLPVRYDPDNPHDAEIAGERQVPLPVGATVRVAAHLALVAGGLLYLWMVLLGLSEVGSLSQELPPEVAPLVNVLLSSAVSAVVAGIVLRVVAVATTPRWHKHL